MQVSASSHPRTLSCRCRSPWEGSRFGFKYSDEVTVRYRVALVAIESWCKGKLRATPSELSADFRLGYGGNEEPSILMKQAQMRGRKREGGNIYEGVKAAPRPSRLKKVSPRIAPWNPTGGEFQSRSEYSTRSFARKYATTASGASGARERTGIMRGATIENPLLIRPARSLFGYRSGYTRTNSITSRRVGIITAAWAW